MEDISHIHILIYTYIYRRAYSDTPLHTNNTCYIDDSLNIYNVSNRDVKIDALMSSYIDAFKCMVIVHCMEDTSHIHILIYRYI
jgi:hypothetical protein